MALITLTSIKPMANDDLLIEGTDGRTNPVRIGTEDDGVTPIMENTTVIFKARGWVSATTNHFDATAYDAKTGHRNPNARARVMTDRECNDYAIGLLIAQNPELGSMNE